MKTFDRLSYEFDGTCMHKLAGAKSPQSVPTEDDWAVYMQRENCGQDDDAQNCTKVGFLLIERIFEPSHEIMALFFLRKLFLQTRMCSHPVGLDV